MSEWTLEIDGETQPVADWGLNGLRLNLVNLGRDTLTAQRVAAFDGAAIAAFGDAIKLFKDGVKWFQGECFATPRSARAASESQVYSFVGPWHFLERNIYKAPWFRAFNGTLVYTSHLIFPLQTVAQHITDALTYAIARGASLQVGTITAPVVPPTFEVTDITIAGAILRLANYAPDCVGWFDYSTTPPTFHFKPRASLTAVDLAMPSTAEPFGSRLEVIEPIARPDLQVDNVQIIYEVTSTVDGEETMDFGIDSYPLSTTGLEDGCLSAVVNLQGFSATTVKGFILADLIDLTNLEWWKKAVPSLQDSRIVDLALVGVASRVDYDSMEVIPAELLLPNRVVDGQAAPWMDNPDGAAVRWRKEIITQEFTFKVPVGTGGTMIASKQKYQVEVTSTNAPVGENYYTTLATFEDGDPSPVGLAEYLYNSLNPLQFDALFVQHKAECDREASLGNVINLQGGMVEWAAMRAVVQQVVFDIDQGVTEISCGPPRHLSIDQILELLRVGRRRRRWTNPTTQEDGSVAGRTVELGKATANNNSVPSLTELHRFIMENDDVLELSVAEPQRVYLNFKNGKTLSIRKDDPLWNLHPLEFSIREVCVNDNGVFKKMLVIGTPMYV